MIKKRKPQSKYLILFILAIISVLITFLVSRYKHIQLFSPLLAIDRNLNDVVFRFREYSHQEKNASTDQFVIIDIDDASIKELGRVQLWPRSYDAKVISHIAKGEPYGIGVDVLFIERDTLSSVYKQILNQKGFKNAESILSALSTDNELVDAVARAKSVYLSLFEDDSGNSQPIHEALPSSLRLLSASSSEAAKFKQLLNPQIPFKELAQVAKAVGTISMSDSDKDGVVRFYRLFQKWPSKEGETTKLIGNFPLYMFLDLMGLDQSLIRFKPNAINIDDKLSIPVNSDGEFRLNWLGSAESFRYISYFKILNGSVPSAYFKDKIVFIGTSAAGLQDIKTVPTLSNKMPGVEVHLTALYNLINQSWIKEIRFVELLPFLILFAFVAQFVFYKLSPLWSLISFVFLNVILILIYLLLIFPIYSALIPTSIFLVLTFFCFTSSVIYRYVAEERKRLLLKSAFQSYVAPELVENIIKDTNQLALGGLKKELTVLFSDIRGFTSYSETLDPQDLVSFLNAYLSRMSETILNQAGTIDKFIGDAIMAIFGAPVPTKDHARKACMSALGMVRELKLMNQELALENKPPIDIGIGINTGEMTVGNIGSERRFDYTVIGDAVNLGARLEGLNKFFGTHILVSEYTKSKCNQEELLFREVATVKVKGKDNSVNIFELVEDTTQIHRFNSLLTNYAEGISNYKNQDFDKAIADFETCLKEHPNDGPSLYYLELAKKCKSNPAEFSLVLKMESK